MPTKRILIIEDEESVRLLLKLYLMRHHFTLMEAKNGLEGLGVARQFIPDLVITDLNMPVMDGIAFVKSARADEKLKNVPVVVVTGTAGECQQRANDAGATAVLQKPISRRDLLNIIELIFSKGKT